MNTKNKISKSANPINNDVLYDKLPAYRFPWFLSIASKVANVICEKLAPKASF